MVSDALICISLTKLLTRSTVLGSPDGWFHHILIRRFEHLNSLRTYFSISVTLKRKFAIFSEDALTVPISIKCMIDYPTFLVVQRILCNFIQFIIPTICKCKCCEVRVLYLMHYYCTGEVIAYDNRNKSKQLNSRCWNFHCLQNFPWRLWT